jgi:hypothetical protein
MSQTLAKTIVAATAALGAAVLLTLPTSASSPRFFDDDPIWVDHDTQDATGIKPLDVDLTVDLAYNVIAGRRQPANVKAMNVNSVDEVPDSSWYTNRLGRLDLSPADIERGPNQSSGPTDGVWKVTSSKSDGVTPGFTVKDRDGRRWFLKFDPPGQRGMATGTEVAVTKLMWALGYNVPENHIAYLRREQLQIASGAKFKDATGASRAMRETDIDALLERAEREPDGTYRVVASMALEGTPVGRIRFFDTRPDDPNDIVPHQHRRELRGYGVFAAWLNHTDAKAINSLDTLVQSNGRSFVKHHLIDFGSTLGSGGVGPSEVWSGSEYLVEPRAIARQMIGFGFTRPRYRAVSYYESPTVGRFAEHHEAFDPRSWKPRVPNQAFLHARPDDQFWAARKLAVLTTDMIRAAVTAGDFGDRPSEAFLVRALAERRDAIVRAFLTGVNPISEPALDDQGVLTFSNAAVDADVARTPEVYRARWFAFDNATGATRPLGESFSPDARLASPTTLGRTDGTFIKVELSSEGSSHASWTTPVDAYFRKVGGGWRLVGFERMPN